MDALAIFDLENRFNGLADDACGMQLALLLRHYHRSRRSGGRGALQAAKVAERFLGDPLLKLGLQAKQLRELASGPRFRLVGYSQSNSLVVISFGRLGSEAFRAGNADLDCCAAPRFRPNPK